MICNYKISSHVVFIWWKYAIIRTRGPTEFAILLLLFHIYAYLQNQRLRGVNEKSKILLCSKINANVFETTHFIPTKDDQTLSSSLTIIRIVLNKNINENILNFRVNVS